VNGVGLGTRRTAGMTRLSLRCVLRGLVTGGLVGSVTGAVIALSELARSVPFVAAGSAAAALVLRPARTSLARAWLYR
jgi:hypothetical protein